MSDYINLFKTEIKFTIMSRFRYKMGIISDLIMIFGTYIFIYFFDDSIYMAEYYNTTIENGSIIILIGYIFWQFAILALGFVAGTISSDSVSGSIEMKIQSAYPIDILYFFKMVANLMSNIVILLVILVFSYIMNIKGSVNIIRLLITILFNIPSIIGMFGIGLMIGAIGIRQKNTGSLVFIIQVVLLFVSNALGVRDDIFNHILPFNTGIDISRDFYMGLKISGVSVVIYILINIIWYLIGRQLFNKVLRKEKEFGVFDTY